MSNTNHVKLGAVIKHFTQQTTHLSVALVTPDVGVDGALALRTQKRKDET